VRIIDRWRKQVERRHQADRTIESQARIPSNQPKSVSPDDIERLEEEMAPWLRKRRRGY
jgi:hypothetical protein